MQVAVPSTIKRLASWHGAAAAQTLERTRAQALAHAARRRSSAGLGQGAGDDAAERSLGETWPGVRAPTNPDLALRRRGGYGPPRETGKLAAPQPLEWLLIEWPRRRARADQLQALDLAQKTLRSKFSSLSAKLRWRIERDYEELKSELGLAHFEGRGWRGFHHHATLCIAAYGFLIRERAAFPPSGPRRREGPVLPRRPRPRGAPDPTRAPRRKLDRHHAKATDRRPRPVALPMPVLPIVHAETTALSALMTQ